MPRRRGIRPGSQASDSHIRKIIHPHRGRHCHVPIQLGYLQEIIGVSRGCGNRPFPGRRVNFFGCQHLAAAGQYRNRTNGIICGVLQKCAYFQRLGRTHNAAHNVSVQPEFQRKVRVPGGIHPAASHGLIQGVFRQRLSQNHRPVIAPVPVVMVSRCRWRNVPACVQRPDVFL